MQGEPGRVKPEAIVRGACHRGRSRRLQPVELARASSGTIPRMSSTADDEKKLSGALPELDAAREYLVTLAKNLNAALAPLLPVVESLRQGMVAAAPAVLEIAAGFERTQELFKHWEQHSESVLRDAVGAQGLIVPFSQMSFQDLTELLALHRDQGNDAVVRRVREHYEELFRSDAFLSGLDASWGADQHLKRRLPLLLEALKAHSLRMFGVSIPTLIAQFEGLIVDVVKHRGRMAGKNLKAYVDGLAASESVSGQMLSSFVHDALLAEFAHGSLAPPFSRHAILHGGDTKYATEVNSRTAILLIDNVRALADS
jgi:hypothetical protein